MAVEIYPRVFTRGVKKSSARARREYLDSAHPGLDELARGIAIGNDDAFDAVVTARVMCTRASEFARLTRAAAGSRERLEGAIWA